MPVTSIRLKRDLAERIEKLATKHDRSKNWVMNQAIERYLDDEELQERRWQETLPALESMRKGLGVPFEEVVAWMESWGTDAELPRPTVREL